MLMNEEIISIESPEPKKVSFFKKLFEKKSIIAVLPLHGVIGQSMRGQGSGLTLEGYNSLLEKAFAMKNVSALVLSINSPGGSPVQTELLFKRIRQLASKNSKIPIFSFVEDVAASGGYWLACAGDEIFALESSILGSIGVISASFGFVEALKKCGIERRIYKVGEHKASLDPFMPENEEDVEIIKTIQKDIHLHFIDAIKLRRKEKLSTEKNLFDGSFWSGKKAKELGLIDHIGDMHTMLEIRFGTKLQYVYLSKPTSWLKRKLGMSTQSILHNITHFIEEKMIRNHFGL